MSPDASDSPPRPSGVAARGFLDAFIRQGIAPLVANETSARMDVLPLDDATLPIVINNGNSHACYLTSPSCHYCTYAADETVEKSNTSWLGPIIAAGLNALGAWARHESLDRTVSVNNWMLSTNPGPSLDRARIRELTRALLGRFPDHALLFRSVERGRTSLAEDLETEGWVTLPNRRVFLWHADHFDALPRSKRRDLMRDNRLLERSGYRDIDLNGRLEPRLLRRLQSLYRGLYITKHSPWSPDFTLAWFENFTAAAPGLFRIVGLERDGEIDAFTSWGEEPDRLTGLIMGYDTSKPDANLYRITAALFLRHARMRGKPAFVSSGAGRFKHLRGARATWEFDLVYCRHLPAHRRRPWQVIRALYHSLADSVYRTGNF